MICTAAGNVRIRFKIFPLIFGPPVFSSPSVSSMATIQARDFSWKARWFSAITSHEIITAEDAMARVRRCMNLGQLMVGSAAKAASDKGIIIEPVIQILLLSDRNLSV